MRTRLKDTVATVQSYSEIKQVQMTTNSLLNWLLQQKSQILANEPDYVIGMFVEQIRSVGKMYPDGGEVQNIELDPLSIPDDVQFNAVRSLREEFQLLKLDIVDAIVFSSVATADTVQHWSDLDVFVIVKDEVFQDTTRFIAFRNTVLELENLLYQFDSSQHHGIQYVMESDLRFYPEAFMPIVVLQQGFSLIGEQSFELRLRDSGREMENQLYSIARLMAASAKSGSMQHHCKDDVCLLDNFKNREDTFYQLKYFVSVILLLPSLYVALVDVPIYKRESFKKIRDYFSEEELELVTACEAVRSLFHTVQPKGNAIPGEVIPVLGQDYFVRAEKLLATFVKAYEAHASS